jgi:formiminoglutamase
MTDFLDIFEGTGPLILSMPHGGQELMPGLEQRLTETGRTLSDTDWWIERLYDFGEVLGASRVRTKMSRYVIDVNRDPSGVSLYPGQATTGLCPETTFDGVPLYKPGESPDQAEIAERRVRYFEPYHAALAAEIKRVRARHGLALLYDCHSIRSQVPRLFEGDLPTFNIGSNGGTACATELEEIAQEHCCAAEGYSTVVNGRFKGGWITRKYGRPKEGIHALQMELAQKAYMWESPPWTYDPDKADDLRAVLKPLLEALLAWARKQ